MDTVWVRVIATLVVLLQVRGDDMDGFKPGFRVEQIFIPSDCVYRAREGDFMYQNYVGTLEDGTQFDSRYGKPIHKGVLWQ